MKVLITGGMGVIGAEVSRKFVHEGYRPLIFARHRDESLIWDIADRVDVELGDILDLPLLLRLIKTYEISHIVHLAAFVGAVSQANPAQSIKVNIEGTVNVLEAARLMEVKRVVYSSAKGVYGPIRGEHGHPNYKPLSEDAPKQPMRIYDSAKLMGEQACLYYHTALGLDTVVLRFATTYGPGKAARHGKMGVTSEIVERPFLGLPFHIEKGGDQKDDFVYNKDSAQGVFLACIVEDPSSRVYNIGTGVGATLQNFAETLRKTLPSSDIQIGPGLDFFNFPYPVSSVYDISRARAELGYEPEYDVDRGVRDYVRRLEELKRREDLPGKGSRAS